MSRSLPMERRLPNRDLETAVLIPCLNEAASIGAVVRDFRRVLPDAAIYVYDNGSSDGTPAAARTAGAIVRGEPSRGKGNVVRRMLADVEADVYVIVDGDGTYDAGSAPELITRLIDENLDMVVGIRTEAPDAAFRAGHRAANRGFSRLIETLFGRRLADVFSGYRVLTRRLAKTFPVRSRGFEIETELAIHVLSLTIPIAEVPAPFGHRATGSESKLSTYGDGTRILRVVFWFLKEVRPLLFFSTLAGVLAAAALIIAYPVFVTYAATGFVPRFPTAMLATGVMLLGFLSLACGLILDSVAAGRWETKRRAYLAEPRFRNRAAA